MIMTASRLRTADDVRLASATTDVTHPIEPTSGTEKYNRAINGRPFDVADPQANPILVQAGSVCGLDFVNGTDMWHPMHLRGPHLPARQQRPARGHRHRPAPDEDLRLLRCRQSGPVDAALPQRLRGGAGMMANVRPPRLIPKGLCREAGLPARPRAQGAPGRTSARSQAETCSSAARRAPFRSPQPESSRGNVRQALDCPCPRGVRDRLRSTSERSTEMAALAATIDDAVRPGLVTRHDHGHLPVTHRGGEAG
ncbi:hypothetical protein [Streptomyces antibioticus]|uniref:hypothetical protein n=1 Tax=Streptomyces antibioticus TaxID=1890 RepID=UPI003D71BAFE